MEHRWNDSDASTLNDDLEELVYLSNLIGGDSTLTQPGGGNSSVKRRETDLAGRSVEVLRVKGSGTDLANVRRGGFSGLRLDDLGQLTQRAEMSDEDMMAFLRAAMLDAREPSPSVETPLHSMLPHRFIVHTHDFATQALTDTERPEEYVRAALGDDAVYVDYVRPGFPLARSVARLGPLPDSTRGMVLGRHGLIAWGDTARACYDNLQSMIDRAERFVVARGAATTRPFVAARPSVSTADRRARARAILPVLRGRLSRQRPMVLHYDDSPEALAFAGDSRAADLAARGMATPEHILRCGIVPAFVDADLSRGGDDEAAAAVVATVDRFASEGQERFLRHRPAAEMQDPLPRVVLLPGLGLVTAMKDKANAVTGNVCYRHVIRVMDAAEGLGGFRFLDEADAVAIEYWSLEMAKLKQPQRELAGRVALVTGAAGGIGRAIAERLAAEHAHVILTDVRAEAVREAAAEIAAACKDSHRIRAVVADAASADATAAAVDDAIFNFGGLDILVANAGYLQAGPIELISEETWDHHFDVNVKGYFLVVREAVKVMKAQGGGVILLNASKGAFAPTAQNAAYASAKAAVAALGRNLATELGPHNIRVNYINADFVDTPLMRAMIEQRAAMNGLTVEAQEDEYRRRNLLHVGPIPPDAVAEAVLFLVSPRSRYTTGAVLTIDGGIKEAMPR